MTLSVVGTNTPVMVPSFSARAGFSGFASGVVALLLHLLLSRFQKWRRRAGVWDSMLVPVEKGPGCDERWGRLIGEDLRNGDARDLKKEDIGSCDELVWGVMRLSSRW